MKLGKLSLHKTGNTNHPQPRSGRMFFCRQDGHYALQRPSKVSIKNSVCSVLQHGVPAVPLVHKMLTSLEFEHGNENEAGPNSILLSTDVDLFENNGDENYGEEECIDNNTTVMESEDKTITNYVASHFVRDSSLLQAKVIGASTRSDQEFKMVNN